MHPLVRELAVGVGKALAQRLARGALPIEDALGFAKQIAEALEAVNRSIALQPAGTTALTLRGQMRLVMNQPDAAIADFVSIVMALSASDPRAAQATAALQAHYQAALATGASPNASLTSTFVVACLSPSFIGIGM